MPPPDESGRRYREPRHGGVEPPRHDPAADDPYGDVTDGRVPFPDGSPAGGSGIPSDGRYAAPERQAPWPPPTALPSGPTAARPGPDDRRPRPPGGPYGPPPQSPPFGVRGPGGGSPAGPGQPPAGPGPARPGPAPYAAGAPWPNGQGSGAGPQVPGPWPNGQGSGAGPQMSGPWPNGQGSGAGPYVPGPWPNGQGSGPGPRVAGPPQPGAPQPGAPQQAASQQAAPPSGGPPAGADDGRGGADPSVAPGAAAAASVPSDADDRDAPVGDRSAHGDRSAVTEALSASDTGRHRRSGAGAGPGRGEDASEGTDTSATSGPGRRASAVTGGRSKRGGEKKRKGSFWRELPLLIVIAIVLTFVIQTFIARIYVIPSASMETTLLGCTGCANDRVAVDKVTYRFTEPAPGDVVVFRGPPAWLTNEEVAETQPSDNALVRGFQEALSLVGLAAPNEKDFVKRVIAVGGQTVACCDPENRVTVDGEPIDESYLFLQEGLGDQQGAFAPVQVPPGGLWMMGDNRNNSADSRFHGPISDADVIGQVRAVVLPVTRWRTVPALDPQEPTATALPAPGWAGGGAGLAGAMLALPVLRAGRALRYPGGDPVTTGAPPRADDPDGWGAGRP